MSEHFCALICSFIIRKYCGSKKDQNNCSITDYTLLQKKSFSFGEYCKPVDLGLYIIFAPTTVAPPGYKASYLFLLEESVLDLDYSSLEFFKDYKVIVWH